MSGALKHGLRTALLLAMLLCGMLAAPGASAHKSSDSYLNLAIEGRAVSGQWDIALRDLEAALGLDADGDGTITWGELRTRHADIAAHALARLRVSLASAEPDAGAESHSGACTLEVREHLIDNHSDGAYAVLRLGGECPRSSAAFDIRYSLLFDLDTQHRGLARVTVGGTADGTGARSLVFSPERPVQRVDGTPVPGWRTLAEYGREGVWHIWIGFDHVLFLISLLLPAVLVRAHRDEFTERTAWQAAPDISASAWEVAKVVTAFTAAHSITLSAAALGWVSLPSRWVETAIAASVVLAALNNLWPLVEDRRWMVAFVFGLIHGFGFASVLADLGLPGDALALALAGFNLGVEAGQLAIVAVFLPLAFLIRGGWLYRQLLLRGGSLMIALLAALWFVERAFKFKLIP